MLSHYTFYAFLNNSILYHVTNGISVCSFLTITRKIYINKIIFLSWLGHVMRKDENDACNPHPSIGIQKSCTPPLRWLLEKVEEDLKTECIRERKERTLE